MVTKELSPLAQALVRKGILDARKREVKFHFELTAETAQLIDWAMLALSWEDDQSPIWLQIDSEGGLQQAALVLEQEFAILQTPVYGVVTGWAFSAAFELLQSCQRRVACKDALLMFHPPYPEGGLPVPDDSSYLGFLAKLARRSRQRIEDLKGWGLEEKTFTAEQALRLGFVDALVKS